MIGNKYRKRLNSGPDPLVWDRLKGIGHTHLFYPLTETEAVLALKSTEEKI